MVHMLMDHDQLALSTNYNVTPRLWMKLIKLRKRNLINLKVPWVRIKMRRKISVREVSQLIHSVII